MLRIVEVDVMKQPSCVVLCIALATSECAEQRHGKWGPTRSKLVTPCPHTLHPVLN